MKDEYKAEIENIVQQDPRYHRDAYFFIADGVSFTSRSIQEGERGKRRHISGQELLEGIREYTLQQFGTLAKTVLNDLGIYTTEDIGNIVFNMVQRNLLGASEEDSPQDFASGYDLHEAFEKAFECNDTVPGQPPPLI